MRLHEVAANLLDRDLIQISHVPTETAAMQASRRRDYDQVARRASA